jgi:hypothetical protein
MFSSVVVSDANKSSLSLRETSILASISILTTSAWPERYRCFF